MSSILETLGIDRLSIAERLQLIQEIWDSLESDSKADLFPMTEVQKEELNRRIDLSDSDPGAVISWDVVEARARARLGR